MKDAEDIVFEDDFCAVCIPQDSEDYHNGNWGKVYWVMPNPLPAEGAFLGVKKSLIFRGNDGSNRREYSREEIFFTDESLPESVRTQLNTLMQKARKARRPSREKLAGEIRELLQTGYLRKLLFASLFERQLY